MTARFPDRGVVERAIAIQINPAQIHLSQRLLQSQPRLDITKVKIRQGEIIVVENLPTYHLRGSYQVNLSLPKHRFRQNQPFDIYIQQQKQNKSWRLLVPNSIDKNSWHGYLIKKFGS